ncbi:Histone-lysine N-methyltransferase [Alternaria tenuissima]|jgi:histone-lysine N-methyltransferase SUV420H|uniref:Histone-lysine N-methyltransferase SET9 n=2 Tax=Alternaria alternata complex TaxID=187734 RepID=A0A4Q4NSC6_ALTAL|nr:Histone-lysine N-methyltransferase [Alternaria alternata]RYN87871.1 Histone-lysine N-methyltransferase [Alternaria tenuissima]RYN88269.1 Histone-lysine N-methyltransferase [Alternaria tenuissima]RYO17297.1 Histone-lysine N-methyltransferase [Alternaria tenuissima]
MAPSTKLTLDKLATFDDIITDALVDKLYFWAKIRKNRGGRFTGSRGLHEEDVADIIRQHVVWEKDPAEAVHKLLQLPGLRRFVNSLKDERDQDQFRRHLRRYVNIYMSDCQFEVTTTNRYMITEHEASITARRDINPREEIKYLTGVQVAMTEEQEKVLELARKDFSLVISSRKKTRSLFLGPARFANHDCDANAKLTTKGYDGMQIVAVKPILEGEEITVSYGEDYFGDDNEECLCNTCESLQQNGWAPMKRVELNDGENEDEMQVTDEVHTDDTASETISSSAKRPRVDSTEEDPSCDSTPAPKRARFEQKSSPNKQHTSNLLRKTTLKKAHSTSSLRQELPVSSVEDPATSLEESPEKSHENRNQQHEGLLTVNTDLISSSREPSPQSSIAAASPKSTHSSTDATSIDEDHAHEVSDHKEKVDPQTIQDRPALGVAIVKEEITTTTVNAPWPSPPADEDAYMSDLSELSESFEFDDVNQQIVKRKPRPTLRTTRSKSRFDVQNRVGTPITIEEGDEADYVENTRKPGDYMTSNALLSAKYSKWVNCQTCDTDFVQQDGYNTRKECPRCERHSKLYGFPWPKTEREGKHDKEERIRDHRTVHRFVDPDQERQLKRDKTKKVIREHIRERFSTPRSARDTMSSSIEVDSGRKRRRVRKTM